MFTHANWAATIGDIATFTHHYEESLIQIERAVRTRISPEPEAVPATMPVQTAMPNLDAMPNPDAMAGLNGMSGLNARPSPHEMPAPDTMPERVLAEAAAA